MSNHETFPATFFRVFRGRIDKVGTGTGMSTSVGSEAQIEELIKGHLAGKERLGFYTLLPDGNCPWAVVEFEYHERTGGLENTKELTQDFVNHLASAGITAYPELSKNANGRCYHVWIFFAEPLSAKTVRLAFQSFLTGVMNVKTEIFPKGYDPTSIGNFVWLPLFGGEDTLGLGVPGGRTVFVNENGKPHRDQHQVINTIKPVSREQFDQFICDFDLATEDTRDDDDDDAGTDGKLMPGLEKVRECSFVKHCEMNAATLPEPQWTAWITNLVRCAGGHEYIHEHSRKHPEYDRLKTDKKINHARKNLKPWTHAQIAAAGFSCDCPDRFKAPLSRATYIDIAAECERISNLAEGTEKIEALERLIKYWSKLSGVEREHYKGLIKRTFHLDNSVFAEKGKYFRREEIDFTAIDARTLLLQARQSELPDEMLGELLFDWMKANGGKFFRDRNNIQYVFVDRKLMVISAEAAFRSYFYSITKLSSVRTSAKIMIDVIQSLAQSHGKRIEAHTWLHTDMERKLIYFNLNNDRYEIVCISPTAVTVMENGSNDDQVLLSQSAKISPIEYKVLDENAYVRALRHLKTLVVDHMACAEEDRLFCIAWLMAGMFFDFTRTTPDIRFEGPSKYGKSTAAELLSFYRYGTDQKKKGTTASNYADGAMNPLVILDNVERANMNRDLIDFILTAVTGIIKEKRQIGSDHGVVQERTKCLILTTGIEGMFLNEVINRTYVVEFDKTRYHSNFNDTVFLEIQQRRNELTSAEFQLASRILAKINDKVWDTYKTRLDRDYPNHAKERTNPFLAIMIMVAEELLNAWGEKRDIWEVVKSWIRTQNRSSVEASADSDPTVNMLDLLRLEVLKFDRNKSEQSFTLYAKWDYDVKILSVDQASERVVVQGTSLEFHTTFGKLAHQKTVRYEYRDAAQLARRFRDAEDTLRAAGWAMNVQEGKAAGKKHLYTFTFNTATIPSGAIPSGAIASGAIPSGAIPSGATGSAAKDRMADADGNADNLNDSGSLDYPAGSKTNGRGTKRGRLAPDQQKPKVAPAPNQTSGGAGRRVIGPSEDRKWE